MTARNVGGALAALLIVLLQLPAHAAPTRARSGLAHQDCGRGYDLRKLLNAMRGVRLSRQDTLSGPIAVGTPADSAYLAGYNAGHQIPAESISVANYSTPPDLGAFIASKIAAGRTPLTALEVRASRPDNPLVLGQSTNGVYYADSGLVVPPGHDAELQLYGTVYLLVKGEFQLAGSLTIIAGNSKAILIVVAHVSDSSKVGIDLRRLSNRGGIPTLLMTDGDVNLRSAISIGSISIFGANLTFANSQSIRYDHACLDPILDALQSEMADAASALADPAGTFHVAALPNPAVSCCRLTFSLPRTGEASLGIYDLAGKLVRQLMRTSCRAGSHELAWDLRSDTRTRVAAGVYFARLRTALGTRSSKLIVLK